MYNYLFKFVVVGDTNVGKSCLLHRLKNKRFFPVHETTVGVDFFVYTLHIEDKEIKLQIWDTAGQEMYNSITRIYYKDTNACLLIFDVSNRDSFINCSKWLKKIKEENSTYAMITLIGNKIDKTHDRTVSKKEAEEFAERNGINYIETSAKDGTNCSLAFSKTCYQILYRMTENPDYLQYIRKGPKTGNLKKMNKQIKYPTLLSKEGNQLEIESGEDVMNTEYCCSLL